MAVLTRILGELTGTGNDHALPVRRWRNFHVRFHDAVPATCNSVYKSVFAWWMRLTAPGYGELLQMLCGLAWHDTTGVIRVIPVGAGIRGTLLVEELAPSTIFFP